MLELDHDIYVKEMSCMSVKNAQFITWKQTCSTIKCRGVLIGDYLIITLCAKFKFRLF
jgi:hypothetical protein